MGEQIKKAINSAKDFWNKQPKNKKILMVSALGAILAIAIGGTVFLNSGKKPEEGFVPLYQGIDKTESSKVYATLQEREVPVQLNENGEVLVPVEQKDKLLIELSEMGFPKTAPNYDIFSNSAGITATEFEQKQYLLFQLQDRIEKTLKFIDGVESAIVTLDVPQESAYVWDEENERTGSASVLLSLKDGVKLSPNKIAAIKNLVASSVPKMSPKDVIIVDAKTSLELKSSSDDEENFDSQTNRISFEEQIENRMVEKVLHVLSMAYGADRVRASASVVIDYDKMMTEQMQYTPDRNGNGVRSHLEETYKMDSETYAKGVAGEERNTDVPIYVDSDGDGKPDTIDYTKNADYLVSYMKQQIEKDQAKLKSASIAIIVDETELTPEKQQQIIDLASKAANVAPENITVSNITSKPVIEEKPEEPDTSKEEPTEPVKTEVPILVYIILGSLLLVLLILLIVFLLIRKRKKKLLAKKLAEEEAARMALMEDEEETRRQKLREAAEAASKKENAVTDEIKEFASTNPEITAALIRTWLREDEE